MKLRGAFVSTLRSKRFWVWQVGGAVIYGIPAAIRFVTGSIYIPVLGFPGFWIDHWIPGNLVEKLVVNAFFPGGAGGVAGEIFVSNYRGEIVRRKTKYLARLGGALTQTAVWSALQYWGYTLMIIGPWGSSGGTGGNIFEHPTVYPFNFLLAALSIFTPDVVGFVKSGLKVAFRKLSGRLH
jgi:hypothetical protein